MKKKPQPNNKKPTTLKYLRQQRVLYTEDEHLLREGIFPLMLHQPVTDQRIACWL